MVVTTKLLMKRWLGSETKAVKVVKDETEAPLKFPANNERHAFYIGERVTTAISIREYGSQPAVMRASTVSRSTDRKAQGGDVLRTGQACDPGAHKQRPVPHHSE